jgi:glycerol uptake facilitator-like aquaporin
MKQRQIAALLAEALGTFVLVLVVLNVSRYGLPFFTAIGAGVAIATFYSITSKFSGGHFNPAITLGLFSVRQITFVRTVGYILAQAAGAVSGWQLYNYLTERALTNSATAFDWRVMIAEGVGMIILAIAFAAVVKQKISGYQAAATLGLAYFVGMTVAGLASNALLNPALALGVRSFDLNYVVGPIIGGLIGVSLYVYAIEPFQRKVAAAKMVVAKPTVVRRSKKVAKVAKKAKKTKK